MKRLSDQTLYEILDVPPDASPAIIESACERAHALYAPGSLATYSLVSPDEAALLVRRIEEARRTLLDPEARARYDAALSEAAPGAGISGRNGQPRPAAGVSPPVIPALQAAPPPPEGLRAAAPEPGPPSAGPAELLAAAARAGGPAADRPRPILLEREIRMDVVVSGAAPAPSEVPARPPLPLSRHRIALTQVVEAETAAPPASAPPPRDVPMPEGSVWTGEALRKVREARGISIQQIAERTKVTRHHVENIEADRFTSLPAPVYLRGILMSIARELRLDGQRVARSYLERASAALSKGGH